MKDIEKKLHAVAHNGNLASPLLLDGIKDRIAAAPLQKDEIKSAKVKFGLRASFRAVASALSVLVICVFSVFLGFIIIMPAGYAPPPDGSYPSEDAMLSLDKLTEIYVADYTPREYSEKHSLGLMYPDGEGKLYRLEDPYANDNPHNDPAGTGIPEIVTVAYKSVHTHSDLTLTIVQTTHPSIRISEYEKYLTADNSYATYSFRLENGDYISFVTYETDDGLMSIVYSDAYTAYLTVNSKESSDLLWFVYQIIDNLQAGI